MESLIIYQLKVAVSISVFYAFYRLLLRRETLHRLNRILLVLIPIASFMLPFLVITINRSVELPPALSENCTGIENGAASHAEPEWWWMSLSIVYALGVLIFFIRSAISVCSVYGLMRRGRVSYTEDGFRMSVVDEDISPCSWLNTIILSQEDYEEGNTAVMVHEKAHVDLVHTGDVIVVDLLAAMQWFNPMMWLLRSDLLSVHEFEADDAVMDGGVNISDYLHLLVAKAAEKGGHTMANSFNSGIMRSRVSMLAKPKSGKSKGLKALYVLPLICVVLAVNAEEKINYVLPDINRTGQIILNHDGLAPETELPRIIIHRTRNDSISVDVCGKPFRVITDDESDMLYVMDNHPVSVSELGSSVSNVDTVTIYNDEATLRKYRELFKIRDSFSAVVLITTK